MQDARLSRLPGYEDMVIDRQSSPFGNPFHMDGEESQRVPCCSAFGDWLDDPTSADVAALCKRHGVWRVDSDFTTPAARAALVAAMDRLVERVRGGESFRLVCHCHPSLCQWPRA